MKVHRLEREQHVPAEPDAVFAFFSRPENLAAITPPWLGFRILSAPDEMGEGTELRYRIRLGLVPVGWVTRITLWQPPRAFVDVQQRGPYALWEHTHRFEPLGGGVRMTDVVRYALPLGPLGALAHALWVRRALRSIFDFRAARIREIFGA